MRVISICIILPETVNMRYACTYMYNGNRIIIFGKLHVAIAVVVIIAYRETLVLCRYHRSRALEDHTYETNTIHGNQQVSYFLYSNLGMPLSISINKQCFSSDFMSWRSTNYPVCHYGRWSNSVARNCFSV